jgi:hypothetical protein
MAANTQPIFTRTPVISFGVDSTDAVIGATAQTALTGTGTLGTDIFAIFTADATNGGYVQKIRFKAGVSAAATTLTCARVFINNGSTNATITNNVFFDDITLPATTPAIAAASPVYEMNVGIALPAGYKLLVTFATATANGWQVTAIGGQY